MILTEQPNLRRHLPPLPRPRKRRNNRTRGTRTVVSIHTHALTTGRDESREKVTNRGLKLPPARSTPLIHHIHPVLSTGAAVLNMTRAPLQPHPVEAIMNHPLNVRQLVTNPHQRTRNTSPARRRHGPIATGREVARAEKAIVIVIKVAATMAAAARLQTQSAAIGIANVIGNVIVIGTSPVQIQLPIPPPIL